MPDKSKGETEESTDDTHVAAESVTDAPVATLDPEKLDDVSDTLDATQFEEELDERLRADIPMDIPGADADAAKPDLGADAESVEDLVTKVNKIGDGFGPRHGAGGGPLDQLGSKPGGQGAYDPLAPPGGAGPASGSGSTPSIIGHKPGSPSDPSVSGTLYRVDANNLPPSKRDGASSDGKPDSSGRQPIVVGFDGPGTLDSSGAVAGTPSTVKVNPDGHVTPKGSSDPPPATPASTDSGSGGVQGEVLKIVQGGALGTGNQKKDDETKMPADDGAGGTTTTGGGTGRLPISPHETRGQPVNPQVDDGSGDAEGGRVPINDLVTDQGDGIGAGDDGGAGGLTARPIGRFEMLGQPVNPQDDDNPLPQSGGPAPGGGTSILSDATAGAPAAVPAGGAPIARGATFEAAAPQADAAPAAAASDFAPQPDLDDAPAFEDGELLDEDGDGIPG